MDAILDNAVARCPFLQRVAAQESPAFARAIAINPLVPAAQTVSTPRPVLEELDSYTDSFRLFHGAKGLVPLPGISAPRACNEGTPQPARPASASVQGSERQDVHRPDPRLKALPLATMSLSFGDMPDLAKLFRAFQQQHMQQRKPPQPRPSRHPAPGPAAEPAPAGQCPMRKVLGPLAPIIFNPKGHLQCPEVIVQARAALAATKPVRELRPQHLLVKCLAVGGTAALVNVPCGMAREHTEKFSLGWFVAVHASIPFIAMLRKAVIMPKYAIIFTIAAAVAGQAIGARLERQRIRRPRLVQSKPASSVLVHEPPALASVSMPRPVFAYSPGPKPGLRSVQLSSSSAASRHRAGAPSRVAGASTALVVPAQVISARA